MAKLIRRILAVGGNFKMPRDSRIDPEVRPEEVMQLIGDRIRALHRQRGWSQEQLGEMVHFSQSKISKIENGDP